MKNLLSIVLLPLVLFCGSLFAANPSYKDFDTNYFLITGGTTLTLQPGIFQGSTSGIPVLNGTGTNLTTRGPMNSDSISATQIVSPIISGGLISGDGLFVIDLSQPQAFRYLAGTGGTNTQTLFVATNGSDLSAVRGDPTHPWRTLTNAMTSSLSGDRIFVGPGTFLFNKLNMLKNRWVQGSGRGITILGGTNQIEHDYWIAVTNDCRLSDFTLTKGISNSFVTIYPIIGGQHWSNSIWSQVTNVVIQNIEVIADTDTSSLNGDDQADWHSCFFHSHWDGLTMKYIGTNVNTSLQNTLGRQRFFDCMWLSELNNTTDITNIVTGNPSSGGIVTCIAPATSGNLEFYGCTMICTNSTGTLAESHPVINNFDARILLDRCTLINNPASTNKNNIIGENAYYLIVGPATVIGHPYPEERTFGVTFTDHEMLLSTNGDTFAFSNNIGGLGFAGWQTADAIGANTVAAGLIVVSNSSGLITDSSGNNRIAFTSTETQIQGPTASQPWQFRANGDLQMADSSAKLKVFGQGQFGTTVATNGFSSRSNLFFLAPTNSASPGDVIVASAATSGGLTPTKFAAAGTGSQTPWTSDINGAGFNLSGAGSIGGSNIVSGKDGIFSNSVTVLGPGPNVFGADTFVTNAAAANNPNAALGIDGTVKAYSNIVVGFGGAKYFGLDTGVTNASGQTISQEIAAATVAAATTTAQNTFTNLTGTNVNLWAVRLLSYATNLPTTGNGTVTWDITKPVNYLETNVDVTINLSGIPATLTNEFFSVLSISNSDTATHLYTLGGFCAFTNGSTVATSTFYNTNNTSKHQHVEIAVHVKPGRSWIYTNALVQHWYDK